MDDAFEFDGPGTLVMELFAENRQALHTWVDENCDTKGGDDQYILSKGSFETRGGRFLEALCALTRSPATQAVIRQAYAEHIVPLIDDIELLDEMRSDSEFDVEDFGDTAEMLLLDFVRKLNKFFDAIVHAVDPLGSYYNEAGREYISSKTNYIREMMKAWVPLIANLCPWLTPHIEDSVDESGTSSNLYIMAPFVDLA